VTSRLSALTVDALDPAALAAFWRALLGEDPGMSLRFEHTVEPKTRSNQAHFDLTSSSQAEQDATVARALELGARHFDVGQTGDEGHVVLADPEGNEFCVIEPGNNFLAGTPRIGALSCDGTQAVGYFWSAALGWPLVWDQDEETAIQSPQGGPKISWGGPPVAPRAGRNRWRPELLAEGDLHAEVDRLVSLGATRLDVGEGEVPVVLADPDGNEFRVR
jgi:hypothetical protein